MQYYAFLLLCVTLGLAAYSIWRPGIACALMWSTFAAEQLFQSQFPFFVSNRSYYNIGTAIVLLVAVLLGARGTAQRMQLTKIQVGFIFFVAYVAFSCFWAIRTEDSFAAVLNVIPYFLVAGIGCALCIRRPVDVRDALFTTAAYGALVLIGVTLSSHQRLGIEIRSARGDIYQANYLAIGMYAVVVGIVSITVFLMYRDRWLKAAAMSSACVAVIALYRSGARGEGIAFIFSAVTLYYGIHAWILRKPMGKSLISIMTLLLICLAIGSQLDSKLGSRKERWAADNLWESTSRSSGLQGRVIASKALLEEYIDNPNVLLMGFGSSSSKQILGGYCHVVPVEILCELGLIGAIAYSLLLVQVYRSASNVIGDKRIPLNLRFVQMALASIYLAMCVTQLKEGNVLGLYLSMSIATAIGATEVVAKNSIIRSVNRVNENRQVPA